MNNRAPGYLFSLISQPNSHYISHNYSKVRQIFCRTKNFSSSFLSHAIREWNKLDPSICQAPLYAGFCKALLHFIRTTANNTFGIKDSSVIKLLTRLPVGFSCLREHKLTHNVQDMLNPLCPCSHEVESTYHFFMYCQNFSH